MQHFLHNSVALLSLCNAKIATAGSNRDLQSAAAGWGGWGWADLLHKLFFAVIPSCCN